MRTLFITLAVVFFSAAIYSQDIEIIAGDGKYLKDDTLGLIVCNYNISEYDNLSGASSLTLFLGNNPYEFNVIPDSLQFGTQYQVSYDTCNYQLYFSVLPLININTEFEIIDEPKVLADFVLTDTTNANAITSYCGIELRGGTAQTYPKKSYGIELWEDESGDDNNKISLLNMRDDDDWILLAMYNEPLRLRNVTNHLLWRKIHAPYYINEEDEAMSGIRTEYIELSVNNEYMGIYALGERMDRKQLQLKKYNDNIRGELYKGKEWGDAVTFDGLPPYDTNGRFWGGFEMNYPDEDEITDWGNLYDFVDFVVNSTNIDFENNAADEFVLNNAIDYFIFLNLLRAVDNTGKNIFVAKYTNGDPYFYVPWDLDGTLGISWSGNQINIYNDIQSNGFYDRLLSANKNLFAVDASSQWLEYRNNGVLATDSIFYYIDDNYNLLTENANYIREALKWDEESINLSNLDYTYEWISNRLAFLDNYFSTTILNVNDIILEKSKIRIYPNPVISSFNIQSSDKEISYELYNVQGQCLLKGHQNGHNKINLTDFNSGLYILKVFIQESNETVNLKVVKQ